MALIDLADAYLHVPVDAVHHRFLHFTIEGLHFQFQCLPFRLCAAPTNFSKVLSAVIMVLRVKGIQIFHYMDDILLLAPSRSLLQEHVALTCSMFSRIGLLIIYSQRQPTKILEYQGVKFNTVLVCVFLPQRKIQQSQNRTKEVMSKSFLVARKCMQYLGSLSSMILVVPWARWRSMKFQYNFLHQWDRHSFIRRSSCQSR